MTASPAIAVDTDRGGDLSDWVFPAGIVGVGLIAGWASAQAQLVDPYLLFRLARVQAWASAGEPVAYDLNVGVFDPLRPVYEYLLLAVTSLTELDGMSVALLPIGAVVMPLVFYSAVARPLGDRPTAFVLALALIASHPLASVQLGTFVYVWANIFLFAFLLVLWKIATQGRSVVLVASALLLFFLTEFLYPTTATWMLFMAVCFGPVLVLFGRLRGGDRSHGIVLSAAAGAMLVYLLSFDRTFAENVFPRIVGEAGANPIAQALGELVRMLSHALPTLFGQPVSAPFQTSSVSSPVARYVVVSQYALLAGAMLTGFAASVVAATRGQFNRETVARWTVALVLLASAIAHTLAYAVYGHLSLRGLVLTGPLIAAMALIAAGGRLKHIRVWATTYVGVSIVGLSAFFLAYPSRPSQGEVRPATQWLLEQTDIPTISADLGLYARVLLTASETGRAVELVSLDSCVFAALVDNADCPRLRPGQLVAFNRQQLDIPVQSMGWREFGPPSEHWSLIRQNDAFPIAYEDASVLILRYSPAG